MCRRAAAVNRQLSFSGGESHGVTGIQPQLWVEPAGQAMGRFSPRAIGGGTGRMLLVVDDPEAVQRRAVDAGAVEKTPVSQEHGWRVGRVVDPYGHEWEIGRPIGDRPPP